MHPTVICTCPAQTVIVCQRAVPPHLLLHDLDLSSVVTNNVRVENQTFASREPSPAGQEIVPLETRVRKSEAEACLPF